MKGKNKSGKADMALSLIQKLYAIETGLKDKSPEEKHLARQTQAKPIINKLEQWLGKHQHSTVNKTKLSEAITYLNNQWPKLITYLKNGELSIDNNRAERAVKPFVIGRKNWLFSQNANGAHASAALYSVVETAKANGLNAYDYISHCLDELCHPSPDIEGLLPRQFKE